METIKIKRKKLLGLILVCVFVMVAAPLALANTQSLNVAYVGTLNVQNGGIFPSTVDGFSAFNFFQIQRTSISQANLGPGGVCGAAGCDTVLLNVASYLGSGGLGCNINNLSTQAKDDLVRFVSQGGKLIIYDSECSPQNYSWLPYPFVTSNPGALGAHGQLTIVENNQLSSNDPSSTYYLNEYYLENYTDAIGDMNVMTTYNAAWCLDMSGTNARGVTGPVHTYARYGSGLIIYNGWDVDYLSSSTVPSTTSGAGNLSKTWYQELLVPFNPTPVSALPCGVTVVGITLGPATAVNDLGLNQVNHTVTAHLTDLLNNPQQNILVTFNVTGVNTGVSGTCNPASCLSDSNGDVSFTYTNSSGVKGTDTITASFVNQAGQSITSQAVTKTWTMKCDVNNDGKIDRSDISTIFSGRGLLAPGDPRDIDGDGWITVNDARACVLQCTNPNCAP